MIRFVCLALNGSVAFEVYSTQVDRSIIPLDILALPSRILEAATPDVDICGDRSKLYVSLIPPGAGLHTALHPIAYSGGDNRLLLVYVIISHFHYDLNKEQEQYKMEDIFWKKKLGVSNQLTFESR